MGKCTFNSNWLLKDDGAGFKVSQWAKKQDEHAVMCQLCQCVVNVSNKGFQALVQHSSTKKHQQQCALKLNPSQLRLKNNSQDDGQGKMNENNIPGTILLYSLKDSATVAELIWTMKTVTSNYSALSCAGITDIFKAMFPNSIPEGFCLNPKKIHYLITDALAPYFQKQILADMAGCFYTLMYDETSNSKNKKELQIAMRYWSDAQKKVVSHHLETVFIGSATAEILMSNISETMNKMKLPHSRLLMLGCDGPNVNKKVHRLMNEEMKLICQRNLVDIGTCNIHTIHNSYLKGLGKLGENIVDLVTSVYLFFDGWPSRWESFTEIQSKEGVPANKFIKHCSSRWLTLEPASRRILEQWPALNAYFLKYVPTKCASLVSNRHCKIVKALLMNPTLKAELYFVISSASIFSNFTQTFQRDEPLVHILYKEIMALVQVLLSRFCKKSFLEACSLDVESIQKESNHLPLKEMIFNENIEKEIQGLRESEKYNFLKSAKMHYMVAANHIIKKTSLSSDLVKSLKCFHPAERKSQESCRDIAAVADALQIDVPHDSLIDEWKALQLEKDTELMSNRIDLYWNDLLSRRNSVDMLKYPSVSQVAKAALVLSHGNAEVERGFSASGRTLTDERASMSDRTLSSIMTVKSVLKTYNNKPEEVPITKELLSFARSAYRSYENYLSEQKKKKEMERQEREEVEKNKQKIEEAKKEALKQKKALEEIEKELKKKKEKEELKRKTADSLFEEARKRLKKGVESKNLDEIHLAEAMLESVAAVKKEEEKERKKVVNLQKGIDKKKATIIQNYVKKNNPV